MSRQEVKNSPERTEALRVIIKAILDQPGMREAMEKLSKE